MIHYVALKRSFLQIRTKTLCEMTFAASTIDHKRRADALEKWKLEARTGNGTWGQGREDEETPRRDIQEYLSRFRNQHHISSKEKQP